MACSSSSLICDDLVMSCLINNKMNARSDKISSLDGRVPSVGGGGGYGGGYGGGGGGGSNSTCSHTSYVSPFRSYMNF